MPADGPSPRRPAILRLPRRPRRSHHLSSTESRPKSAPDRRLLDVFGLTMRHEREKNLVECEVTITSETVDIQCDAANVVMGSGRAGSRGTPYGEPRAWLHTQPHHPPLPTDDPVQVHDRMIAAGSCRWGDTPGRHMARPFAARRAPLHSGWCVACDQPVGIFNEPRADSRSACGLNITVTPGSADGRQGKVSPSLCACSKIRCRIRRRSSAVGRPYRLLRQG
ncbi:hypothetical protein E1293_07980 [Actinomadura darangshiensis]|uniref:Uncharacterized protein n=1 Tax=Actinomadura darangshiensis TaxID=705336 RepID=A0A4R5BTC3_9ACTN|nr:hypothetical protein E1293_07980 [Actinomadura darangshiensis]